ncbi:MAG: AMP-binding protein, partial [bacterium]|nr:AMP-binding protein [bacterium]
LRVGIVETPGAETAYNTVHNVHPVHPIHDRYMLIDMHHIITDGTSQEVLLKELFAMYAGETLPPLKLQYKEYAGWQNSSKQKQSTKQQEEFWLNRFAGEHAVLNLPTDYPRPEIQRFKGKAISFQLSKTETANIKEIAKENETTLYMTILSIFTILLSKLSGQEDIIVGTPTAGRRHAELGNIVGMFVNTLAMRNEIPGEKTFREYLKKVKINTLAAFENQEYQFEDLIEKIQVTRDTGRNPLFDVMFNYLNQDTTAQGSLRRPQRGERRGEPVTDGHYKAPLFKPVSEYEDINTTSKFDLNLTGNEDESKISFQLEYSIALFKTQTIDRFITYFKTILRRVVQKPGISISEIEIIGEDEKNQILYEFNGLTTTYPHEKTIHELFLEQVEKTPDNISIVGNRQEKKDSAHTLQDDAPNVGGIHESPLHTPQTHKSLPSTLSTLPTPSTTSTHETPLQETQYRQVHAVTYRELNDKSNRLARHLLGKGVKPGTIAAIMVERSIEMIIGIIAILKAGGAYLPIDPAYPPDRIKYMLEDSNAKIVLKEFKELRELNELKEIDEFDEQVEGIEIIDINTIYQLSSVTETQHDPSSHQHPSSIRHPASSTAYIIYTSGSTGKPKGVIITHGNLVNLLYYQNRFTGIDFSRVLQFTTIGFDVAAQEIFSTLLSGGRLSLIARETLNEIPALFEIVRRDQIKTLFFPASFLMFTMNEKEYVKMIPTGVRHIVTAGEQVVVNDTFREYLQKENVYLHNHYGPSETHVVTTLTLEPTEAIPVLPNIGKPIANTTIYIMDKNQNLLPQNIAGELYIGGAAVGKGYLNNPELTAEKFVNYKLQKTKKENEPEKGQQ